LAVHRYGLPTQRWFGRHGGAGARIGLVTNCVVAAALNLNDTDMRCGILTRALYVNRFSDLAN
jgi:hypothetical protein